MKNKIIYLTVCLSFSFFNVTAQAMKKTDQTAGDAMSAAWHQGVSTNHRNPSEYNDKKGHRTPGEFLSQGNHRTPAEWISGAPSKNKPK
jgi:hypothetical protein